MAWHRTTRNPEARLGPARQLPPVWVSSWRTAPVYLPDGVTEFAIGDIHGCLDHLEAILARMSGNAPKGSNLTMLGDIVDRGRSGVACLRAVQAQRSNPAFDLVTCLLGNHEAMLLLAMSGRLDVAELWLGNGGTAVLAELGLEPACLTDREGIRRLRDALGDETVSLIESAASHRRIGNILFVHAGVDPAVRFDAWFSLPRLHVADEHHWSWIRFPFFGWDGGFEDESIVVHGHTSEDLIRRWKGSDLRAPRERHSIDGSRLGLDAGTYRTGLLAGAEFRNGRYRIYLAGDSRDNG